MKTLLIPIVILFSFIGVKAQSTTADSTKSKTSFDKKIFIAVEHPPEFKGGITALTKYLQQNVHYPASAVVSQIQGKVYVSFIIEKDGSLTDIKVIKGLSEDIDAEAIKVMKVCPNWNAGMQNGRPVRVSYMAIVTFFPPDK